MPDGTLAAPTRTTDSSRAEGRLTRRRFWRVAAAVAGVPLMIQAVRALAPKPQLHRWHGEVLGALAELTLWHPDAAFARQTILRVRQEIDRLERIFSLYRTDSEISRLNEAGRLIKPSPELRKLVEESQRLGELSGGAFDISVQPLWRLYEAHFWSCTDIQPDIAARARDVAHAVVDFRQIDSGAAAIAFARAGMAITLNSMAQGFITDAIADMLRNEGFESRMVDLDDMALAVSGGYGTTFEESGRYHHIFDPHTGSSANSLVDVAVIGPRATAADGLATAICVAGEALAPTLLAAYPQMRAMLTRLDGTSMTLG